MTDNQNKMTIAGVERLKEELDNRRTVISKEISERLKIARSFGDLSENSEYDDAKQTQAENEARIIEIEELLKTVIVVAEEDVTDKNVVVGVTVHLKADGDNTTEVYHIVGPKEEDLLNNRITTSSPLGQALMGKKKNQVVNVIAPQGTYKYKITKIEITKNEKTDA